MVVDKSQGPYPSETLQFWGIDTYTNKNTYDLYKFREGNKQDFVRNNEEGILHSRKIVGECYSELSEHHCAAALSCLDGIL